MERAHIHTDPARAGTVSTRYRRICTPIPVPESLPLFARLAAFEPRSMGTQVQVVWDRAEGFQIHDPYGNCWIDFTSGIMVANVGHSHPRVREALRKQIDSGPLHSYLFATEVRAALVEKLIEITPANLEKVFLLSTGTEAIECAMKLARLYGLKQSPNKSVLVSFTGCFHGRTMGSQTLYSDAAQKTWITNPDPDVHHIPFPRCCECPWGRQQYDGCGEECFEKCLGQLAHQGVRAERIAAFVAEGYQGIRGPIFFPNDYIQALRKWADNHGALLIVDEIQSGFGRTGKLFAYQHYGTEADLVCCGKGLSSCLPLSAVLGRAEIMDVPDPGQMTSTHTGNPACCAATLASVEVLGSENLIAEAAGKGRALEAQLREIQRRHPDYINMIAGRGLVYSLFFIHPATKEPDVALANRVATRAIEKGVMLFITGNGSIKICPPLVITPEALAEGVEVIGQAVDECLLEKTKGLGIRGWGLGDTCSPSHRRTVPKRKPSP